MLYDAPSGREPHCRDEAARIRDRVLLYARGLELDPVLAVELALESMREAGLADGDCAADTDGLARRAPGAESPCLPRVMSGMRRLLHERGGNGRVTDAKGRLLASMPPLNRRPMLPEEMDRSPVKRALKKLESLLDASPAKPS